MQSKGNNSLFISKFTYTLLIVLLYLVGKGLPLYGVDVSAYMQKMVDAEDLLMQTISGDINQCSIFALGISPYMISSIAVQILYVFRSSEVRQRTSPKKKNKLTLYLTLAVSTMMAVTKVGELKFYCATSMFSIERMVAVLEMITGAFLIIHMISENQKYGIGGQSVLIFINIIDGIIITLKDHRIEALIIPILISLVVMVVVLIMENAEKRIPVQRISIHNIYADKNYLAIKLNPIGIMPVMFSTAFFMVPQLIVTLLLWFLPKNGNLLWLQDNLVLDRPFGIAVYAIILFGLTIGFSRVMINPKEMTEIFLKSGDSICDLHAGHDTEKYLSKVITRTGCFSSVVMCICLCVPLLLQLYGSDKGIYTTLPSSVMMLTGVWCNLYRETLAIRDLEAYKPFI